MKIGIISHDRNRRLQREREREREIERERESQWEEREEREFCSWYHGWVSSRSIFINPTILFQSRHATSSTTENGNPAQLLCSFPLVLFLQSALDLASERKIFIFLCRLKGMSTSPVRFEGVESLLYYIRGRLKIANKEYCYSRQQA